MSDVIHAPDIPSCETDLGTLAAVHNRAEFAEAIKGDHQRQPIVPEQWQPRQC